MAACHSDICALLVGDESVSQSSILFFIETMLEK